jgi:hypothetical protein
MGKNMKFRWGFVISASMVNLGCAVHLVSDRVAQSIGYGNDVTQPLALSLFFLNCLLLLSLVRLQLTSATNS